MQAIGTEFRIVLRKLARSPFFTLMSVLTLALGIAGNTAVFSVIHGVLLQPLPFHEPDQLVGVWHRAPGIGFDQLNQAPALHFTYREQSEIFEDVGMWDNGQATITGGDEPERLAGIWVTEGTLDLLRVRPVRGRLFTVEDDSPGAPETVILSHGYWQAQFGGKADVLGETLTVDGTPHEIIGVLPADMQFLDYDPELYFPFQFDRSAVRFGNFSFQGLARLRPGKTLEQANEEVNRLIPIALESFPMFGGFTLEMAQEAKIGANLRPLKEDVVGDVGNVLWVLLGSVGLVLLVACANVANLFLVRAEGRKQELAVRTALGATRGRLAGEFLRESIVLGLLSGVVGLWLAWGGIRLLVTVGPRNLPRIDEISIGGTALLFNLGISLLAGVLFGLLPVIKLRSLSLLGALKEGGRSGGSGRRQSVARNALVVAQVAMALVILVASGLMMRSFMALSEVHPGFERPEEVLTLRVSIPTAEVEDPLEVARMHEEILRRLEQIPGVSSAGASSSITMDGWDSNDPVFVEEFPTAPNEIPPVRRFKWVMPGYFETMENPVLAGRGISWDDLHAMREVVVVSESFSEIYWASPLEALGKRIRPTPEDPWREIVGVVGKVHDNGIDEEDTPVVFWPLVVANSMGEELRVQRSMAYALRTDRVGTASLLEDARQAVWAVNGNLPLARVRTLEEILRRSMARTSFTLTMLGIAALVALLLGAVGIYGVTSYTVSQRTREIGLRMALGAQRRDVGRLVLRHALLLVGAGIGVGILAALGLTRLMSALLFGVNAVDPLTYVVVTVALGTIALVASYFPARRAAGINPMEALHWE